jgi:DNA-binding NarL/FixJ family response regulator
LGYYSFVKLAILDDHQVVADSLKNHLLDTLTDAEFVYCGGNIDEICDASVKLLPDLVIVDLDLGDNKTPAMVVSKVAETGVRVLVLSASTDSADVLSALSAGAIGYITKHASSEELIEAIVDAVEKNEVKISPYVAGALAEISQDSVRLSAQEKRALVLYASGLKLEAVARRMNIAPSTAKQYIDRVKSKYQQQGRAVHTKTDMYRAAKDAGYLK